MNKREFLAVRDEWYSKLKEEGFKDIENSHADNPFLTVWEKHYFKNMRSREEIEDSGRYYETAIDFLHQHIFLTEEEKVIWEYHTEGLSLRQTAKKLKKTICSIHKVIRQLKLEMISQIQS